MSYCAPELLFPSEHGEYIDAYDTRCDVCSPRLWKIFYCPQAEINCFVQLQIYSLGVILHVMAWGRVPHMGDSLEALRESMRRLDQQPLSFPALPARSADLQEVVRLTTAIDPAARPDIDTLLQHPALRRHDPQRRLAPFAPTTAVDNRTSSSSVSATSLGADRGRSTILAAMSASATSSTSSSSSQASFSSPKPPERPRLAVLASSSNVEAASESLQHDLAARRSKFGQSTIFAAVHSDQVHLDTADSLASSVATIFPLVPTIFQSRTAMSPQTRHATASVSTLSSSEPTICTAISPYVPLLRRTPPNPPCISLQDDVKSTKLTCSYIDLEFEFLF